MPQLNHRPPLREWEPDIHPEVDFSPGSRNGPRVGRAIVGRGRLGYRDGPSGAVRGVCILVHKLTYMYDARQLKIRGLRAVLATIENGSTSFPGV